MASALVQLPMLGQGASLRGTYRLSSGVPEQRSTNQAVPINYAARFFPIVRRSTNSHIVQSLQQSNSAIKLPSTSEENTRSKPAASHTRSFPAMPNLPKPLRHLTEATLDQKRYKYENLTMKRQTSVSFAAVETAPTKKRVKPVTVRHSPPGRAPSLTMRKYSNSSPAQREDIVKRITYDPIEILGKMQATKRCESNLSDWPIFDNEITCIDEKRLVTSSLRSTSLPSRLSQSSSSNSGSLSDDVDESSYSKLRSQPILSREKNSKPNLRNYSNSNAILSSQEQEAIDDRSMRVFILNQMLRHRYWSPSDSHR